MYGYLRGVYGRLRRRRVVGAALSRLVWAAKGLLGRPVKVSSAPPVPPPPRRPVRSPTDARVQVALAAVEALTKRVAALEAPQPPIARLPTRRPAAATPAAFSVSVVISTLDRAEWLDRALTALAYQRHPAFEVIVIAGPCRDATTEVLARHAGRVRTAACPVANLSASRNVGLALAGGDIVAFLDDDAVPEPDWLERLCRPYEDPEVGGVGGVIRDAGGVDFQCRTVVADRFGRSWEADPNHPLRLDPPGEDAERFLSLTGANSSFRRSALLQVGGFDEAYAYFLDETDVCLRLAEAGWRLEVAGDAEVCHGYAPSAQRDADRTPRRLHDPVRSTAYFTVRNAAPRHGWPAVAEHLHGYAEALRRDVDWRSEHNLVDASVEKRLLADVDAGLRAGVEAALEGPRKLLAPSGAGWARRPSSAPVLRPPAERLRVGLLSQDYPGEEANTSPPGGVAVWTKALADALAGRGHEVSVFTRAKAPAAPTVRFEAQAGAGVWMHRFDPTSGGRPPGALARLPPSVGGPAAAAAREVARIAPRRRFDILMGPLWDLEPAALVDGGAWPTAVSLHTACAQMTAHKPEWTADYRRRHVDWVIAGERRLLREAEHVLSNSFAAARDIGAALQLPDLAARATVMPHGLPDLARGVEATPTGDGVTDILFVGRLELRKGVDVLLEAAPQLLAAAPEARLTLVGEDVSAPGATPWRDLFLARHAGAPWLARVQFAGPLERERLLARYAACDVVVVPSRYESFGLTALEAMIFAKPCVASATGGLAEVVVDGKTGVLVPLGDASALAGALLALVRAPERRRSLGAAGRRRYQDGFTAEAMAKSFEAWAGAIAAAPRRLAAE